MPEIQFYLMKYKFIAIKPVYDIISRNKGEYNWSMIWLCAEPWEKLKHAREKKSNYAWSEIQSITGQRLQGKTALFAVCLVISARLKTIAPVFNLSSLHIKAEGQILYIWTMIGYLVPGLNPLMELTPIQPRTTNFTMQKYRRSE